MMEDGHIRVPVLAVRMEIFIDSVCRSVYKNYSCLKTFVVLYLEYKL
jgi:hypothetical protein